MKRKWILALSISIITVSLLGVASVLAATGYTLDWWTVDGGGAGSGAEGSTGGSYGLGGTIGQPDAGTATGGEYTLEGGFWVAGMNTPGDQALSISKVGEGTVTSDPAGIDCGLTCEYAFPYNQSVILTAEPATDWTFTGWSDAGCPGMGTCTLLMTEARSVTATFTRNPYRIHLPLVIR